jgi:hypothetical protein
MTTARSEKYDKRKANRKFRRVTRANPEDAAKHLREVSDVWAFAKDGKIYLSPEIRKIRPKVMRK